MGSKSLQELQDNALAEKTAAQEYANVSAAYNNLKAASGQEKSETELVSQAIHEVYGDRAGKAAQEIAHDSDKFRVAMAGEYYWAAKKVLEDQRVPLPANVFNSQGAAWEIMETRNDMRHPDSGKRPLKSEDYQRRAAKASIEVFKIWKTLKTWVEGDGKNRPKPLTGNQRIAVNKARGMLVEMYNGLEAIQSRLASPTALTEADLNNAKNTRIVQASGWAEELIHASRKFRLQLDPDMVKLNENGKNVIHVDRNALWPNIDIPAKRHVYGRKKSEGGFALPEALLGALAGAGLGAAAWSLISLGVSGGAGLPLLLGLAAVGAVGMAAFGENKLVKDDERHSEGVNTGRLASSPSHAEYLEHARAQAASQKLEVPQPRQINFAERYGDRRAGRGEEYIER